MIGNKKGYTDIYIKLNMYVYVYIKLGKKIELVMQRRKAHFYGIVFIWN